MKIEGYYTKEITEKLNIRNRTQIINGGNDTEMVDLIDFINK
jgi:DNA-binding CsgD family transcriptional regulator